MSPAAAYIAEACRLTVFLVLAVAVAGKAMARQDVADSIADLIRVPERVARAGAALVLGAEGLIALLLLAGGGWSRPAMAAAIILFAIFAGFILLALVQRRAVVCSCFGGRGHPLSFWDLVRNLILIAAGAIYLRQSPLGHALDPAAWLLLAGIAFILFLVATNLNRIALLAR
jgi:hypothetical protein